MASENNKKLLERLRTKYDLILMDCPPTVGLSDAVILSTLSDVNLVTVSVKKTKMENLERTKKAFDQANTKIDGVILNKDQLKGNKYYNYYYNSGYYNESK